MDVSVQPQEVLHGQCGEKQPPQSAPVTFMAPAAPRGLPGVRDCAHPHVRVMRHALPCGGALFVGSEPVAPAEVESHQWHSEGTRLEPASPPPSEALLQHDESMSDRRTSSDGNSYGQCSSDDGQALSSDPSLARASSPNPGVCNFGDTPPFPGNGGTRVLRYASEAKAATECAALAAGMSLKHKCFHTGFSGAKLVASVADPAALTRAELVGAVSSVLNAEEGRLYTGCDLNTSLDDMAALYAASPYVLASLGACVDPNVATGYGVAGAVAALATALCGSLVGCTIFVQGCGKVGGTAAQLLLAAGATVLALSLIHISEPTRLM
jgi:hypothetical protein